jgi:hypothetical protein
VADDNGKGVQGIEMIADSIKWLSGQTFNNVMLACILIAIGWGTRYAITEAIPAHLKTIQTGYESIDKAHREERKDTRDMYDRWFHKQVVPQGIADK